VPENPVSNSSEAWINYFLWWPSESQRWIRENHRYGGHIKWDYFEGSQKLNVESDTAIDSGMIERSFTVYEINITFGMIINAIVFI
jgi:hypothetical protein